MGYRRTRGGGGGSGGGLVTAGATEGQALTYDSASSTFKPRNVVPGLRMFGNMFPCTGGAALGGTVSVNSSNSRVLHNTLFGFTEARLVYMWSATDNSGSPLSTDVVKIHAAIENPFGAIYPVTFNGQYEGSLSYGGILMSDPVSLNAPPPPTGGGVFAYFYSRTHMLSGAGGVLPCSASTDGGLASGEAFENGTSLADKSRGGTITGSTGLCFRPSLVVGSPTSRKPLIIAYGDSITAGTGDVPTAGNPGGFPARALYTAGLPYIKFGTPSALIPVPNNVWNVGTSPGRGYPYTIFQGASHLIHQFGVNDIYLLAHTTAQVQAAWLLSWTDLTARGMKVAQTTLTPESTSTDGWATTTNQTTASGNPTRVACNNWLRAGAPIDSTTLAAVAVGTSGALVCDAYDSGGTKIVSANTTRHPLWSVFEVADLVESARDSGIWKANYSSDGTHLKAAGASAAAAGIRTSLLTV